MVSQWFSFCIQIHSPFGGSAQTQSRYLFISSFAALFNPHSCEFRREINLAIGKKEEYIENDDGDSDDKSIQ